MNKNIIYLILVVVVLVGATYYFSGNKSTEVASVDTNVTATTTDEVATTTATTSAVTGTNVVTASKPIPGYPASWPSDVPKYPTEVVKYNGGNNPQSGPVEATVVFTTNATVKNVVNFYLNGLRANGWKITEDGAGLANLVTFRATKAKRGVGGYVERGANGKTTVTIGVNIGI